MEPQELPKNTLLSVIAPMYNEQQGVITFVDALVASLETLNIRY